MKKDRRGFIGSSEIAAVMGLSRWETPLSIWAIKTGELEAKDLSENEYVEWGSRLEEVVSQKFAEKNNVKLMAYKKRYKHDKYPFLTCELDRLIVGTEEILEVKTCNAFKAKEWVGDEIPQEYILQVMFALGLSGRKVGHVAVLIGGNTYREKKIIFDPELYETMVERAVAFMKEVEDKTPPDAMYGDKETLRDLYPQSAGPYEVGEAEGEGFDKLLEERAALVRTKASAKERMEEIENEIKQTMGASESMETPKHKISWKTQVTKRVDTHKLKLLEAGIYQDYCKETQTRVFRSSRKKEVNL